MDARDWNSVCPCSGRREGGNTVLNPQPTVMVVDDEQHLRESLVELFTTGGYRVLEARDGLEALEHLQTGGLCPDAILMDLKMPRSGGMETLRALATRESTQEIPVVIITAFGGSEQTIQAMKAGAFDYITKPFDADELLKMVHRAVEMRRLSAGVHAPSFKQPRQEYRSGDFIGHHPRMRELFKLIGKISPSDATVLLTGESGTGKELVAQAIHRHSPRSAGPLVSVNCAAIPEGLLESELFGHERGAFTGAVAPKPGRFELAEGGTLFLDEVGELSPNLQGKLLRVLQDKTFDRLGGQVPRRIDFRLVAATNQNLRQLVTEGRFREDLYYRLHVVAIEVPPLRARRSDIPILAECFLERYRPAATGKPVGFSEEALHALLLHDYPGNVRELEHLIQRAVVVAQGPLITLEDLPGLTPGSGEAGDAPRLRELLELPLEEATQALERMLITRALTQSHGNKAEAARLLGIHRTALYTKLKQLGMEEVPMP
ncbi:MAG: sigma-54-dependent Fis family transcriptional regulator [Nitrospira defluvii]|nr:sigma-54-dependent Fis family transcriptional regulator [Nitrospira defluvii]